MEALLKEIANQYEHDPSTAGLVVAALKDRYYASVVRYHGKFGTNKETVVSATAATLEQAIADLARYWHAMIENLARLVP